VNKNESRASKMSETQEVPKRERTRVIAFDSFMVSLVMSYAIQWNWNEYVWKHIPSMICYHSKYTNIAHCLEENPVHPMRYEEYWKKSRNYYG